MAASFKGALIVSMVALTGFTIVKASEPALKFDNPSMHNSTVFFPGAIFKNPPERQLSKSNTPYENFTIGWQLYSGANLFQRDRKEAFYWLQQAANSGHTLSTFMVGYMLHYGDGIEINYPEAGEWFQKASDSDMNLASFYCGLNRSIQASESDSQDAFVRHFRFEFPAVVCFARLPKEKGTSLFNNLNIYEGVFKGDSSKEVFRNIDFERVREIEAYFYNSISNRNAKDSEIYWTRWNNNVEQHKAEMSESRKKKEEEYQQSLNAVIEIENSLRDQKDAKYAQCLEKHSKDIIECQVEYSCNAGGCNEWSQCWGGIFRDVGICQTSIDSFDSVSGAGMIYCHKQSGFMAEDYNAVLWSVCPWE